MFNGRHGSLSDIVFFVHVRYINKDLQFGILSGVQDDDQPEITIPLRPIMRNHAFEGDGIKLLANYGILFLFLVFSTDKDTKSVRRLLLVNILSATTTEIPKPQELCFTHSYDVCMVLYSSNSVVFSFRILYVEINY